MIWQRERDLIGGSGAKRGVVSALVRLRWIGLVAQLLTIVAVRGIWQPKLPWAAMFGLLVLGAVSNWGLSQWGASRGQGALGAAVVFDILLLTALLGLSGGPANPFSVLYLVQVLLAATIANRSWTWVAVAASGLGFGGLFFFSLPLPPQLGGHGQGMAPGSYSVHLQGMWLAQTLAAVAIAFFVSALSSRLREERERRERTARLLGLATLAAGAAHEIGNPLGTIRIAAGELSRDLKALGVAEERLEDLALINDEVDRARVVLRRLASSAGELSGEPPRPTDVGELLRTVTGQLEHGERVQLSVPSEAVAVQWPVQAISQAFTQLLRNALQASPDEGTVSCEVQSLREGIEVDVRDTGIGMSPEVLARVGEPFFSTRSGDGMGLGVFIARSLVEHLGGRMNIQSRVGSGTHVNIWLPCEAGK